jgi:tRNA G37 N-methylase TrmD
LLLRDLSSAEEAARRKNINDQKIGGGRGSVLKKKKQGSRSKKNRVG